MPMSSTAEKAPKIHVLSDLSLSQQDAIRRIPDHGEVSFPAIEASRPAKMFVDEDIYRKEQTRIFRRLPVPVTLSAYLREPGSMVAQDGYGLPLLITRDKEGTVRVFLNACKIGRAHV